MNRAVKAAHSIISKVRNYSSVPIHKIISPTTLRDFKQYKVRFTHVIAMDHNGSVINHNGIATDRNLNCSRDNAIAANHSLISSPYIAIASPYIAIAVPYIGIATHHNGSVRTEVSAVSVA